MTDEQRLIEKLQRIEALFAGAATPGERDAAAQARDRIRNAGIVGCPQAGQLAVTMLLPISQAAGQNPRPACISLSLARLL